MGNLGNVQIMIPRRQKGALLEVLILSFSLNFGISNFIFQFELKRKLLISMSKMESYKGRGYFLNNLNYQGEFSEENFVKV